jgi:hypothetical protein
MNMLHHRQKEQGLAEEFHISLVPNQKTVGIVRALSTIGKIKNYENV